MLREMDYEAWLYQNASAPTIAERYRRDRIPVAEVLRTGVHYYNNDEELDRFLDVLESVK